MLSLPVRDELPYKLSVDGSLVERSDANHIERYSLRLGSRRLVVDGLLLLVDDSYLELRRGSRDESLALLVYLVEETQVALRFDRSSLSGMLLFRRAWYHSRPESVIPVLYLLVLLSCASVGEKNVVRLHGDMLTLNS